MFQSEQSGFTPSEDLRHERANSTKIVKHSRPVRGGPRRGYDKHRPGLHGGATGKRFNGAGLDPTPHGRMLHSPEVRRHQFFTGTIDELLFSLGNPRAAVLLGPSTPFCPELFA